MKNQNNNLEKNNIFSKMKSWMYNLIHKSKKNDLLLKSDEYTPTTSDVLKENNKENNFFEEYRLKNERHQYLLNLQRKYKNKEILERDMSQEDRNDLENLYIEQNNELKMKIRSIDFKITKASGK